MTPTLRVLLLLSGVITALWILSRIHRAKVRMEDSIFWICLAFVMLVMGAFPSVIYSISNWLGFQAPVNCVFLIIIAILLEKVFTLSIKQSNMEDKMEIMAAEIAIRTAADPKKKDDTASEQ